MRSRHGLETQGFSSLEQMRTQGPGPGSHVAEPECKDGDTAPGEGLAHRTLGTLRAQSTLPV